MWQAESPEFYTQSAELELDIVLLVISFQFNESFDLSACPLLFQDAHIPG